jgi:hypothetical protein
MIYKNKRSSSKRLERTPLFVTNPHASACPSCQKWCVRITQNRILGTHFCLRQKSFVLRELSDVSFCGDVGNRTRVQHTFFTSVYRHSLFLFLRKGEEKDTTLFSEFLFSYKENTKQIVSLPAEIVLRKGIIIGVMPPSRHLALRTLRNSKCIYRAQLER